MSKNILTKALEQNDLDAALKLVMDALGIEAGDVAAQIMSEWDDAGHIWRSGSPAIRDDMLVRWLSTEIGYAALDAVPKSYIVAIYLTDRAYGGPEEGGWWYNTGARVTEAFEDIPAEALCSAFDSEVAANEWAEKLQATLDKGPNSRRRSDTGSVLSEGRYVAEIHEGVAPNHYPATKPHYE